MTAQIELIKGDMFDGPSDLVVIPCSTIPTITWFVAEHLRSFGIPEPREEMELGDVAFVDLRRANNIAQVAAMAASVLAPGGSTLQAIQRGSAGTLVLTRQTIHGLARSLCPLLGTGAGALEATVCGPGSCRSRSRDGSRTNTSSNFYT